MCSRVLFFLAVAALCATDLRAQAAAAPLLLRLERGDTLGPGSIAVAEGTASTSPVRFRIEGVDVAQPITVAAAGGSASRPLTVSVSRTSGNRRRVQPLRALMGRRPFNSAHTATLALP